LPCCAHAYGAVEAAFALRDHANLDRLTAIKIETYHAASVLANRAPTSRAEAKLSLPYCVVAALREPALTEESFSDEAIDRVAKDPLMALISIEDSTWSNAAFPSRRLTRLSLADRAGAVSSFDAEVLHRPTKNRDVIDQKFRASVEPVLGSAIDELIDLIEHLDTKVDSLAHLTKFFSQTASSYRGGHRFI
jgi:2-methylcitrate dehydratase PrpD